MYLLYSLLFGGLLLLGVPYLLYRALLQKGYARSLVERVSVPDVPPSDKPTIWLHAVSVGEVIAAATLLPALEAALPDTRFVVSVITVTGRRIAEDKLSNAAAIFYCPFDLAFLVRRVVQQVKPQALVLIETEIWPNLLRECKRAGAATMIAAGRISDRSFPRYRRVRRFMKRFLAEVDIVCVQNELYRDRIEALGVAPERIRVTGSLKFDAVGAPSPFGKSSSERVFPEDRRILVAGSTLDPEEAMLLRVFESLSRDAPDLFLVLAPRHPPRFDAVVELVRKRGHRVLRRSQPEDVTEDADVMILDTLGELAGLYREADYVFVGGSLVDAGGHNIIEPASQQKPVVFGPDMRNFADIARLFLDAEATVQVQDRRELESVLREWIENPRSAHDLAERTRAVIEDNRGASNKTVAALKELLG